MNKENLLREMKSEMIKIVENIDYNTIYDAQLNLEKYFNVMSLIWDLPLSSSDPYPLGEDMDLEPMDELEEVADQSNGRFEGKVRLKLGGADLGSFKIFIPEKLIRLLDIEEGDWVRATEIDNRYINGHPKAIYDYRILKKAPHMEESRRNVIKFSTVEYDELLREYYILSSEIDKAPTKIILNEQRLGNLTVSQGDIVDYAYWKDDLLNGRVIWKYNMTFNLAKGISQEASESVKDLPEDFLEGSQIAFIGKSDLTDQYKTCIGSYGGQVSLIEERAHLEESLGKVDLAIVFVDALSPSDLKRIQESADKIRVAMLYAKEMDCSSLMIWIRDELEAFEYQWL